LEASATPPSEFVMTTAAGGEPVAAAWVLTRVLANLFLGVSPHDPGIFVGAAAVFAVAS
jgi:hypothetical protein